mgnify:CR=1 FL=1
MKDINWLKDNYLNFLEEKQKNIKSSIKKLQEEDRMDEANFEKIRLNVVEIFTKMFAISNSDNPKILKEKFLGFFDKITKPWYVNMDKALKFEKEEKVIIEEIKIQESEELKTKFIDCYNQMDKLEVI